MSFPKYKFLVNCPDDDYYQKYWYKSLAGSRHFRVHTYSHEELASICLDPKYEYTVYVGSDVVSLDIKKITEWVKDKNYVISGVRDNGCIDGNPRNETFLNDSFFIIKSSVLNSTFTKSDWLVAYLSWVKSYRQWAHTSNCVNPAADYFFHYPILHGLSYLSTGYMNVVKEEDILVISEGMAKLKLKFGVSIKNTH